MNDSIKLTDAAVEHIKEIIAKKPNAIGIRVGVKSSGCSGMSYTMDIATKIEENDHIFEKNDIKVVVNAKSFAYLKGTQIDCVQKGLSKVIQFNNPNAESVCGCGESFNLKNGS
jgi:iron-sulfur cluster assembly protein